jgi:hypothetical protein
MVFHTKDQFSDIAVGALESLILSNELFSVPGSICQEVFTKANIAQLAKEKTMTLSAVVLDTKIDSSQNRKRSANHILDLMTALQDPVQLHLQ